MLTLELFDRTTSTIFVAPSRQARQEKFLPPTPNLGGLCAFARVTVFPVFMIRNSVEISKMFA
jgi:hypothetical protein